ncbi:tetratricopeptide repeat protein [Xylophilus sp.]|uniref:tetratricopeptide repeat protein n=1 Tax=Xylophilus sp. TaxID=2653893 RepID=UPI002D7F08DE|nr:tetratricopeptide repeat protein [Xylophilus sp.]
MPTTLLPPSAPALLLVMVLLAGCAGDRAAALNAEAAQARAGAAQSAAEAEPRSDSRATHIGLVRQMQDKGLWYASLAHLDAIAREGGGDDASELLLLRAHALRHTGRDAEALRAYQRLSGTPLEAAGLHGQGLLAGAQGDYSLAASLLEEARRRAPTDAALLSDLGYARLRAGQRSDARTPLLQAAQLQPADARIQANLALWLLLDGQPAQAQRLMDSQHMPAALRGALARQAQEIDPAVRLPQPPAPLAADDDGLPPLALRPAQALSSAPAQP